MRPGLRLLVLLLSIVATPARADGPAHAPRGLLDFRDPYPLAGLHLQLPTVTQMRLRAGEQRFEGRWTWANHYGFSASRGIVVDAETHRLELEGWLALTDDLYIGLALPLHSRGSGSLDSFIENFHDTFNLSNGGRDRRSRDAYAISIASAGGPRTLDRGTGAGGLTLQSRWNVPLSAPEESTSLSVQGQIRLPTGPDDFSAGGVDVGLAAAMHHRLGERLFVHGSLGAMYLREDDSEGLSWEHHQLQAVLGVEYAFTRSISLTAQLLVMTPLLERPGFLGDGRRYAILGMRWGLHAGLELQLGVAENLQPFDNTADLALQIGLTSRF